MNIELIKGTELTDEQKAMLEFNGMKNPEWVNNHEFYFIDGKPASEDSGYYYPVCKSFFMASILMGVVIFKIAVVI